MPTKTDAMNGNTKTAVLAGSHIVLPPLTMTEKEYRSHPAISRSELWRMHESPEKFKWFKDHPPAPTPALAFGQYVHALLLTPETITRDFLLMPELNLRTKDGREQRDLLLARCKEEGLTPVDRDTAELARNMVAACQADPDTMDLLTGIHEQPFFWLDETTGIQCKCRTDVLTTVDGEVSIVDYKSTANASTHAFVRDMYKYGYHFQTGFYCTGVKEALHLDKLPRFFFVAQEKTAPYSINRIEVPEDVIQLGIDKYREFLGIYRDCMAMDWWYGYTGPTGMPNEAYILEWVKNAGGDEE